MLTRLRRHLFPISAGIAIVFFALLFQTTEHPLLKQLRDRLEWTVYDLRLQATLTGDIAPHPSVIIIDIDEKSLAAEGHWPWPRAKLAQMMENMAAAGVVVTAFDIVFSEPEANAATSVLNVLADTAVDPAFTDTLSIVAEQIDGDTIFTRSLHDKEVVMGFAFLDNEDKFGSLGPPLVVNNLADLGNATIRTSSGYLASIEKLQQAARYSGFFNARPDSDGLVRRSGIIYRHADRIYPSLALEAVRLFYAVDDVTIKTAPISGVKPIEYVSLGFYDIPTDGRGAVLVPFRGPPYSFHYIPATDVINGNFDPAILDGTIAFVGTSATGLSDIRPTPVSNVYPGVEVHANIAAGILDMQFPYEPVWATGFNFIMTLVVGLFLALLLPFMSPLRSVLLFISVSAALIALNAWLWSEYLFVVAISSPLIMVFLLATSNSLYGFLTEAKSKKQLREQFGQYVPPQLVDEMMNSNEDLGFEGEKRDMTVLFADIRSFTTISESLSAQDLARMLNRFFTPMTEIIFTHKGTIDKYVGDMIMAFWGAPLRDGDHARHAIQGALAMLDKVDEIKSELMALGYPEINLGVGLNTGSMNVGNMGSDFRRAYTVLGDSVNLGSRLEGLTKQYGVKLICGETTRAGQTDFLFRRLDKVRVKGKNEPVIIYEPLCSHYRASEKMHNEVAAYESALDLYYARDWTGARQAFAALKENDPGRMIYSIYLDRMASQNVDDLPADWDGTFTHTSK
ncbi:adenylate/guanylate cyclase domain-containing protein [Sulfuriflexus sp.]|uniref:CHASE2 domain-containing protein n=1 Tax=Sulfuriflexus sp. TaxID=2015443 RepID=UPI0028CC8332|nr:adenylate/guanylate cyclase domain-containing protein [Sulfuriflexus sp.]MDT8404441.1 adenylate/guanylate cyclase domain-containing protein [Sulfuriflexus sp.]